MASGQRNGLLAHEPSCSETWGGRREERGLALPKKGSGLSQREPARTKTGCDMAWHFAGRRKLAGLTGDEARRLHEDLPRRTVAAKWRRVWRAYPVPNWARLEHA